MLISCHRKYRFVGCYKFGQLKILRVTNMTASDPFKKVFNYVLWALSCVTCFYFIYINVDEIVDRSAKRYTIFSQMSWLTDGQAELYCSFLTITFISLLALLGHRLYSRNKKGATLISILTLILAIAILFLEPLLYNKPV